MLQRPFKVNTGVKYADIIRLIKSHLRCTYLEIKMIFLLITIII